MNFKLFSKKIRSPCSSFFQRNKNSAFCRSIYEKLDKYFSNSRFKRICSKFCEIEEIKKSRGIDAAGEEISINIES